MSAFLVWFVLSVPHVSAAPDTTARTYLIATDVLCVLFPSECPAIARADNGDTVEITGMGTFTPHPKLATGAGTFVHKSPGGAVIASGTWEALELISFKSYGTSALFPATFEGGRATLRILLSVSGTPVSEGVLQVDCLVGNPPAGAVEGVRLVVQAFDFNFNKEVSGVTLFLLP